MLNALVGHVDDDFGGRETVKCGDTLVKNAHKKKKKPKQEEKFRAGRETIHITLSEQTAIDPSSAPQMPFSLQMVGVSESRFLCV